LKWASDERQGEKLHEVGQFTVEERSRKLWFRSIQRA
jgi:hypothetical protein